MEAEQGAPAAMINCQDNLLEQVRFRRSVAHQFCSARPCRVGSQIEAQPWKLTDKYVNMDFSYLFSLHVRVNGCCICDGKRETAYAYGNDGVACCISHNPLCVISA